MGERSLQLDLSDIVVSTSNVPRVIGNKSTFTAHPGRIIAHFIGWSADLNGEDMACADTSCLAHVTGHSGVRLPPTSVTIPRISEKRHSGVTTRISHELQGRNKGFQVIAESVVLLSHRLSSDFIESNQISIYKDNDCFYRASPSSACADARLSPLQQLAAPPYKATMVGAPLVTDDYDHNLFAWQNSDIVVGHISLQLDANPTEASKVVAPNAQTQEAMQQLAIEDEAVMRKMWARGGEWFEAMFRRGQASASSATVQYPSIYQQLVPCARKTLQCHQATHQLNAKHCQVDPDVMLELAHLGCALSQQTMDEFVAQCAQDPHGAMAGAHSKALQAAAEATRYAVDMGVTGPTERFTNMFGTLSALHHAGLDSSHGSADCEDFGYFLAKLHTAYANLENKATTAKRLKRLGVKDHATGAAALHAISQAARCYAAFPVTCSTYAASAHGDVVPGSQGAAYTTHTTMVLMQKETIDAMKRPMGEVSQQALPGILVEGTALVACDEKQLHSARQSGQPLPVDIAAKRYADQNGADATFPMLLENSHFFAFANQLIHEGNGYICVTRSGEQPGRLGVPFNDFIADPAAHCRLEAMYPAPSAQECAANRRFLAGRCPTFKLHSLASNTQRRKMATCVRSQVPEGPWGIIRGVLPVANTTPQVNASLPDSQPKLSGARARNQTEPAPPSRTASYPFDGFTMTTYDVACGLKINLYTPAVTP